MGRPLRLLAASGTIVWSIVAGCSLQMPQESDVFGRAGEEAGGTGESVSTTGGAFATGESGGANTPAANGGAPSVGDGSGGRGSGATSGTSDGGTSDGGTSIVGASGDSSETGASGTSGSGDTGTAGDAGGATSAAGAGGSVASGGSSGGATLTAGAAGGIVVETGLVAYFPFDESTGETAANAIDATANGTYVGSCTHPEQGAIGGAVSIRNLGGSSFTSDWIELPPGILSALSAASVSIWTRDLSPSRWGGRLFHFSRGTDEELYFSPHDVMPGTSSEGSHLGGTHRGVAFVDLWSTHPAFTDQAWHHIVITWDSSSIVLYVDGSRVGRQESPGVLPSDLGNTSPDWLGRTLNDSCIGLYAEIDDLRIYDRVLTSPEIAQLHGMR